MKYTSKPEIVLSSRLVRLCIVTLPSHLEVGRSILLLPADLLTLVLQAIPHITAVLSYDITYFKTKDTSL